MELSDFAATKTSTLEIVHPGNNKPMGLAVTLRSTYSAGYREAIQKLREEHGLNSKNWDDPKWGAIPAITSWEWRGDLVHKGTVPELTLENIIDVFSVPGAGFMATQVNDELQKHQNFFPQLPMN